MNFPFSLISCQFFSFALESFINSALSKLMHIEYFETFCHFLAILILKEHAWCQNIYKNLPPFFIYLIFYKHFFWEFCILLEYVSLTEEKVAVCALYWRYLKQLKNYMKEQTIVSMYLNLMLLNFGIFKIILTSINDISMWKKDIRTIKNQRKGWVDTLKVDRDIIS